MGGGLSRDDFCRGGLECASQIAKGRGEGDNTEQ